MNDSGPPHAGTGPAGEATRSAWTRTNEDRKTIADERRKEGWNVASIPAVHTSPVAKDQGDDERFGLVHIIPNNYADEFTEAYERGTFPEYLAYRSEIHNSAFLVVEHLDPESDTAIVISSHYDLQFSTAMMRSVLREGVLNIYAKTLDGTVLGSFELPEYDAILPIPEKLRKAEGVE